MIEAPATTTPSLAQQRDEHRAWIEKAEPILLALCLQQLGKDKWDQSYVDGMKMCEYHMEEYERLCLLAPEAKK